MMHRAHLQVIGVKMSVWQTSAQSTLCALASRLPAMSDRSWFPQVSALDMLLPRSTPFQRRC